MMNVKMVEITVGVFVAAGIAALFMLAMKAARIPSKCESGRTNQAFTAARSAGSRCMSSAMNGLKP